MTRLDRYSVKFKRRLKISHSVTPFAHFRSDMLSPKVDVAETKDAIEVTAELPGVDEKDLDVTLVNGILTVRGEKKSARDEQDKDKNWHVMERSYLTFIIRPTTMPLATTS
jgi:HSP20 family molecular chaperone IbpA